MISPSETERRQPQASTTDRAAPQSSISADSLSTLLGYIYDTAQDSTNWTPCLQRLITEFKGNYASLIVRPASTHDLGYIISVASDSRNLSVHYPYIVSSPFSGRQLEKVLVIEDILSQSEWEALPYYRDYCKPNDVFYVMAVDIEIPGHGVYGLRITRSAGSRPFSREEKALCEQLIPHLKRALTLQTIINQDEKVSALYRQAIEQLLVGVFVLDEKGAIIESNAMANAIIDLSDGLVISNNRLGATYCTDNQKLQRLIRKMLNQHGLDQPSMVEAMSINRPSGRVPWGLVVQPIAASPWTEGRHRPCVAIFLRDAESKSEPPLQLTQQLFQLTPAETVLTIELANGLSLDEASEVLNIRRNTARAHLRSIFSKTGVRRQTELVRIFLNSVALLGNRDKDEDDADKR